MKNNVNTSHWKLCQSYTAWLCAGSIKAWQKQEILRREQRKSTEKSNQGNIRNHSNFGKDAIDVIVKVYIKAIKNLWMQIHRPTTKNLQLSIDVHGSVHRKNILIYFQQDTTLHSLFYLESALNVSGGTTTHHQERKHLYLQHLVFVTPLLPPAAIAAGSSNGVTNTRCCRYSCLCSWWWVVVLPETCRAVSR